MDAKQETKLQLEQDVPEVTSAENIIESSRVLVRSLQYLGFFPLSVSLRHRRVRVKLRSLPFIYNSLIFSVVLAYQLVTLVFYFQVPEYLNQYKHGPTERLTFAILHIACAVAVIMPRILVFARLSNSAKFWNVNFKKLEDFQTIAFNGQSHIEGGCFLESFTRIKFELNRVLLLGLSYFCAMVVTSQIVFISTESADLITIIFGSFWDVCFSSSFVHIVYIAFFLKVYSSCTSVLSQELRKVGDSNGNEPLLGSKLMITSEQEHLIRKCLRAYEIIETLVSDFNEEFSLPLMFHFLMYIIITTVVVFFDIAFILSYNPTHISWMTFCAISLIWQMSFLAWQASCVSRGAQQFQRVLSSIDLESIRAPLRSKMLVVIQRIHSNPLTIKPGDFFTLDRRLLTTILGTITMYLIILIQFYSSDKGDYDAGNGTLIR